MRHQTNTIQKKNNQLSQKRKDFLEAIKDFKDRQAKDKRSAKKAMGVMQTDHPQEVYKYVLHLWPNGTYRCELADGSLVGQGISRGLFEIRFESAPSTVLVMQHSQRRNGGRLLLKNVKGKWTRVHGKTPARPASKRKSTRFLPKVNPRVSKNPR